MEMPDMSPSMDFQIGMWARNPKEGSHNFGFCNSHDSDKRYRDDLTEEKSKGCLCGVSPFTRTRDRNNWVTGYAPVSKQMGV